MDEGGRFCCSGGLDGLMRGFIGAGGGEGSAVLLDLKVWFRNWAEVRLAWFSDSNPTNP